MKLVLAVANCIAIFLTINNVYAIDCSKAITKSDITICSNPYVKYYDNYMSEAYNSLYELLSNKGKSKLKQEQIAWIKRRDEVCVGDADCLNGWMYNRNQELVTRYNKRYKYKYNTNNNEKGSLAGKEIYKLANDSSVMVFASHGSNTPSQGSGVVIKEEIVATNAHVAGNDKNGIVLFKGKTYPYNLLLEDTELDLALLLVKNLPARKAKLRLEKDLSPGQTVYSFGSPKQLYGTIANGLLASFRQINGHTLIQFSAPISPGSSGGGLFDDKGSLIGITTSSLDKKDAQNINFAIPIDSILEMLSKR